MVNLKTKDDKHALDNEKRRKSIKEKEKAKINQANIIKQALSSSLNNSSSKKIIFDDDDDHNTSVNHKSEKTKLFDGSSSEDENFEIKEKVQFGGKKGLELLNLQSTYGNDDRFKIDERFLDDESENVSKINKDKSDNEENDGDQEKTKQLKILESVLGHPISKPDSEKKKEKKRTFEMVRYDLSNKDHEKYETKPEIPRKIKKIKEIRKSQRSVNNDTVKPEVSKEKFYEVSSNIKASLKDNREQGGSFSLLQTYGQNDSSLAENENYEEDVIQNEESESEMSTENYNNISQSSNVNNKFRQNGTSFVEEPKVSEKSSVVKGIWKESFFFASEDPRFKEGLEFINKKNSDEASEAAENYDKTRRKLKEILRLHMKKQLHRKDPFKTKIGGMNKKQLANMKSKNSKKFSKKKLNKT